MVALRSLGELVEGQLLQELHLALDRALRQPLVLVEHLVTGVSSSIGEGAGHPCPNPAEFLFYHQSIFVPLIFSPFPSVYLVQGGGS